MKFLDKLLGRAPTADPVGAAEVRAVVVPASAARINTAAIEAAGRTLREWVMTPANGVGILTGCGADGLGEVTIIKGDGTTHMVIDADDKAVPLVVPVDLAVLRRAYIDEVPACRHPDVDHDAHMRSFGFIHSSEAT